MNKLIFETLLAEASFRVAEKTITGISIDEAIHEVAGEMELDKSEVDELTTRAKKAPRVKPVVEDDDSDDGDHTDHEDTKELEDEDADEPSNTLVFNTSEELDTAIGVLMYKGIAWTGKSDTSVSFENAQDVKKAKEALGRRWDFIVSNPRVVATLQFDNLEDYSKVLDFIASKKMGVISTEAELEPDLDMQIEEAAAQYKRAKRDAKASGLPAPEMPAEDMSFKALHKDNLLDPASLDVLADNSARALHVVKRWK